MLKTLVCGIMWIVGIFCTNLVIMALTTKNVDFFFIATFVLYAVKFTHFLIKRRFKREKEEKLEVVEPIKTEEVKVKTRKPRKESNVDKFIKAFLLRLMRVLMRLSIITGIIAYIIDTGGITKEGVCVVIGLILIGLMVYAVVVMFNSKPIEERAFWKVFGIICGSMIANDILRRSTRRR